MRLWRQIILKDFFRAQWTEIFFSNYSYERVRYMLMVLILLTCRSNHCRCFIKKVFFKISQNSQENTCIGVSFFKKIAAWRPAALRDSNTGVFRWISYEIFMNTFLAEHPFFGLLHMVQLFLFLLTSLQYVYMHAMRQMMDGFIDFR